MQVNEHGVERKFHDGDKLLLFQEEISPRPVAIYVVLACRGVVF
jgi:hypothetical protein